MWSLRTLLTGNSYYLCHLEQSLNISPQTTLPVFPLSAYEKHGKGTWWIKDISVGVRKGAQDFALGTAQEYVFTLASFIECPLQSLQSVFGPLPQAGLIE